VAGSAHTTPPPVSSSDRPAAERPLSSNISQNYPYTSETDFERAAKIATLLKSRKDLAAKLAAETTPLDTNERWWVWKCPTPGCPGLLHVAGYAAEKHALYVVCDGTCGKTFLR
jgi:hypothetical protein